MERAAIAEQVASTLRHDMRNKFASIRNAAFYIKKSLSKNGALETDPRVSRFLDLIGEQLEQADELLTERAQYGDAIVSSSSTTSVDECVASVVQSWSIEGPTISCELSAAETATLDAIGLQFSLGCLLENAVEACGSEGSVTIRTRSLEEGWVIEVEDSSCSFDSEKVSRALNSFESTKEGHWGIGLNMASRSMRLMGGRLELPGEGALHPRLFVSRPAWVERA
jgi:signal transduction histidine kinase